MEKKKKTKYREKKRIKLIGNSSLILFAEHEMRMKKKKKIK